MAVVAYDIGRTHCRGAAYRDDGTETARAERPTAATAVDHPSLLATTLADLAEELSRDPAAGGVTTVGAGMAGMAQAPDGGRLLAILADLHPGAVVTLTSDMVTAHAGALDGVAGVTVAAGTGAVAFAADGSGGTARADGWGYLLGDEGSGYAVGRAGLAAALREHDGRGGSDLLRARAMRRFGEIDALPSVIHRQANPARSVASFAADVLGAAADGEPVARRIVDGAARSLSESAAAAARAAGLAAPLVSWSGGMFRDERLRRGFERHLARLRPDAQVRPPVGDALRGARTVTAPAIRALYAGWVLCTDAPSPSHSS